MFEDLSKRDIDHLFDSILAAYDAHSEYLDQLLKLCQSKELLDLYRETGCPPYFDRYEPIMVDGDVEITVVLDFREGREKQDIITLCTSLIAEAAQEEEPARRREIVEKVLSTAIQHRCTSLDLFGFRVFGQSISEAVKAAHSGDKEAFITLVELDSSFLTADFGQRMIREAELAQDQEFQRKLSIALDPYKKPRTRERQRNRYALEAIIQLGLSRRKYKQWCDFLVQRGFANYADEEAFGKAVKRLLKEKRACRDSSQSDK